ncbi:hypothetical protein EYF80_048779 [Liparis tanakae]|uniref:Uncharacterized protein n=1 Tax=Liparis tanakae TaxID=230148 RepID=A0A4Z2FLA1_9TELE|nr:hypothetical protein EYF80_048779 [Liparis tanakae]
MKWQREPGGQAAAAAPAGRAYLREAASAARLSYVNVPFHTLVILLPPSTKVGLAHQAPPASAKIPRIFQG